MPIRASGRRQPDGARLADDSALCSEPAVASRSTTTLEDSADPAGRARARVGQHAAADRRVAKRSLEFEGFVAAGQGRAALLAERCDAGLLPGDGPPVGSGRAFTEPMAGAPVAMVSAATARRFWPAGSVGRHVRFVGELRWRTVVGVVADVRALRSDADVPDWIDGTSTCRDDRRHARGWPDADRDDCGPDTALRRRPSRQLAASPLAGRSGAASSVSDVQPIASRRRRVGAHRGDDFGARGDRGARADPGGVGVYAVLSFLVSGGRATSAFASRSARCPATSAGWCCARARRCARGPSLGVGGARRTRWLSSELHGVSPPIRRPMSPCRDVALVTLVACLVPTPPRDARRSADRTASILRGGRADPARIAAIMPPPWTVT